MPEIADGTAYCTILAKNYLPKALTLAASLTRHHPGSELVVLLIDAKDDADLPDLGAVAGVRLVSTADLGLSEREILHLVTIYSLVEFATAVKPLILKRLLEASDQAIYLDPDTYVTSPMLELPVDLRASDGGILVTPHFLEPLGAGAHLSEGHLLTVGVYNLGFCAVDRRAIGFLDWWWGHLKEECLWDPLSGLFVDQKWVDIGGILFAATPWRHYGYNVSIANLHERPIERDSDGYYIASNAQRLRLFHFHSFDTSAPEELTTRSGTSTRGLREGNDALNALCVDYATELIGFERSLPSPPPYAYETDTKGRRLSRQLRRAYRLEAAKSTSELPSPFLLSEANEYDRWRRGAWRSEARALFGDLVKSARIALPEEYSRAKERLPGIATRVRSKYVGSSGRWH